MITMQSKGQYTGKAGNVVTYDYDYVVYNAEDAADHIDTLLSLANRQAKVDGNNRKREAVKSANGDSSVKVLTPEQKAANKEANKQLRDLAKAIKSKGLSLEEIQSMIG